MAVRGLTVQPLDLNPHHDCTEILPWLYLSSVRSATDQPLVQHLGISRFINCTTYEERDSSIAVGDATTLLRLPIRDTVTDGQV
jgi:hypothetical protein